MEGKGDGGGSEGATQSPSPVLGRRPLGEGGREGGGGGGPQPLPQTEHRLEARSPYSPAGGGVTLVALSPGVGGTESAGIRHWPWHDLRLKQMARERNKQGMSVLCRNERVTDGRAFGWLWTAWWCDPVNQSVTEDRGSGGGGCLITARKKT